MLQGAHQRRSKTVEGDPLPLISPVPQLTMEQKKRGGIGGNQRVKHLSVAVEPVFGLLPFKLNVGTTIEISTTKKVNTIQSRLLFTSALLLVIYIFTFSLFYFLCMFNNYLYMMF